MLHFCTDPLSCLSSNKMLICWFECVQPYMFEPKSEEKSDPEEEPKECSPQYFWPFTCIVSDEVRPMQWFVIFYVTICLHSDLPAIASISIS